MEKKGEGTQEQLVKQEKTQGNMASPKLRPEVASKQKAVVKQEISSLDFAQVDQKCPDKNTSGIRGKKEGTGKEEVGPAFIENVFGKFDYKED